MLNTFAWYLKRSLVTTPYSHSRNEINYAVNVNKEYCANNQIMKQYRIPTSFFVKLGWIILLIHRNCWRSWVVLEKTHRCGKLVVCKTHYQLCNMLYRFFVLQQHLTLLKNEPASSGFGHLILLYIARNTLKFLFLNLLLG